MFEIREATIGPDHRRCHAVVLIGPETADESKQSINDARDRSIDNEQWEHWGLDADAVVIVADREEQPWTLPMVWSKVMERDEHPFARVFVAEPEDDTAVCIGGGNNGRIGKADGLRPGDRREFRLENRWSWREPWRAAEVAKSLAAGT